MIAYLASFMLGATAIVAAPQTEMAATTPDIVPAQGAVGENLKVHGNIRWDVTGNGDVRDFDDLGNDAEWDNEDGDDLFDTVVFEPAYDEDTRISSGASGSVDNLLVTAQGQYHPTFWMPEDCGTNTDCATQPGTDSGLFDVDGDNEFDFKQIDDEEFDTSIDSDNSDNPIDLVGVDDNLEDFASRNDATGSGDDIYFPAWVWRHEWLGFDAADEFTPLFEDDEIRFPISGLGGQPGLNSFEVEVGSGDTEVAIIQHLDTGPDLMRLETKDVTLQVDETARFWDFQITVEAVNDVAGGDDDARLQVEWLGDHDDPQEVGSSVTAIAGDTITASRTSTAKPSGDCTAGDGGRPGAGATRYWYACVSTVDGSNGNVFLSVGRLFQERADDAGIATILVNGAFYSVRDLDFDGTDLERVIIEHAVPLGDDVELKSVGVMLQGAASGETIPVISPFNDDHTALENFDVAGELNTYGFLRDVDADGDDEIEADDIDLDDDARAIKDRKVSRSALDVNWVVRARNAGLLANRETPLFTGGPCLSGATAPCWQTSINNVYPNNYVEIAMPSQGKAVVHSGLFSAMTGMDTFLWDPAGDNSVYFGSSVRVFSEDLAGGDRDRLIVNPAIITEGDTRASGSNADLLVQLELTHCAFCRYDDIDDDDETDLNVLNDEEEKNAGATDRDTDTDEDTIDADGDNLFDVDAQNNDDDEGDVYGPGVRQVYRFFFLDQGTSDPTAATDIATSTNFGPDTTASETKSAFPVATDVHDGEGLDSADLDGDGDIDETFIDSISTGAIESLPTVSAMQIESETLTVPVGERAQMMDYEVLVEATDPSYSTTGKTRLKIFQVQEAGVTNNDVASFPNTIQDRYVGISHDYSTGLATVPTGIPSGGSLCLEVDDQTGPACSDSGTAGSDFDFYVRVNSIASDSVSLVIGRFLPQDNGIFVDGQRYTFTAADFDGTGDCDAGELCSFTVETITPIGDDVQLQQPDLDIAAIGAGDSVPLLAPFNADHQVVDNIQPKLEQDEFGFFNEDVNSDGDATELDVDDRILNVGPLDVVVSEVGVLDRQRFIWLDQRGPALAAAAPDNNVQHPNGYHEGGAAGDGGVGCADGGDQDIDEGPECGGWPAATFDDTPPLANHQGLFLDDSLWDTIVPNEDRGYAHFVALDVPSGHGQYLLESARMSAFGTSDNGDAGANTFTYPGTGDFGIDAHASGEAMGWYAFSSSNILDFFLGDGTVPAGQETTPEEEAKQGRKAAFQVTALSCSPSQVTAGQAISCTATVLNTGNDAGSATVRLRATHQGSHMTDQVVAQGVSDNVAIDGTDDVLLLWSTSTADEGGTYQLVARSSSTDVTKSTTVTLTQPSGVGDADISVQSCSVSGTIAPGETIVGSATFVNNGDVAGSDSFNVLANGNPAASVSSGNVPAGDTRTQSVSITLGEGVVSAPEAGQSQTVTVSVGGVNCGGSITVSTPEQPDQPVIPGFEVAALLTAVGAALLLLRRREL